MSLFARRKAALYLCVAVVLSIGSVGLLAPSAMAPPSPFRPSAARSTSVVKRVPVAARRSPARLRAASGTLGTLPLRFEVNPGQTGGPVRFLARGSGITLFLTGNEAVLAAALPLPLQVPSTSARPPSRAVSSRAVHSTRSQRRGDHLQSWSHQETKTGTSIVFRLRYVGASTHLQVVGLDRLPGYSNYFIGNDPRRWHLNVPGYARVALRGVYPGVTLVYHGTRDRLEYDWVLAPGASPRTIRLAVEGTGRPRLDAHGNLIVANRDGQVRQDRPVIYQQMGHGHSRRLIPGHYVLKGGNEVAIAVGAYDVHAPLIIDPVVSYATYLGGRGSDGATGIAVDSGGATYITGVTTSPDFPTTAHAFQPTCTVATLCTSYHEAFVTKLSADGRSLLYSTYLGGQSIPATAATGIAVDSAGSAYVTGYTGSTTFPTTPGTLQPTCRLLSAGYCTTAFVTKLSPDGSTLLYSTYLGGSNDDLASSIAVDSAGSAYITGRTTSTDFPTTPGAVQPACTLDRYGGCVKAFVTKLSPDGSTLIYGSYLGGSNDDLASGIAVDSAGSAYITGRTTSTDFPTTPGVVQPACKTLYGACAASPFVAKLSVNGASLAYSTYLGGSLGGQGTGIAVDSAGSAYVTGYTASTDFPTTPGALQTTCAITNGTCSTAFVAKLSVDGRSLAYSTYLGGTHGSSYPVPLVDAAVGIAVDSAGNAYVTGNTDKVDVPTTEAAFQRACSPSSGPGAACLGTSFMARLSPSGSTLTYGTYLGGSYIDLAAGIAVDVAGNAYIAGQAQSGDFPTTLGALQLACAGGGCGGDVYVVKLSATGTTPTMTATPDVSLTATSTTGTSTPTATSSIPSTPSVPPTPSPSPTLSSTVLAAPPDPIVLSSQPITENPAWQTYVITDHGGLVYPVSVTVQGDAAQVDNPTGLLARGMGVTTIHATGSGQPALLLDLGINTGGTVEVGVTYGDGTPVVLAYSEARRFLTPQGDGGTSPFGADDDPDGRTDTITATNTTSLIPFQSPGIRGAERWIQLQLAGKGTVSLSYVRVRVTHYQPALTSYVGRFLSNDDQVNRTWYAGAYTLSMNTLRDLRPGYGGNLVLVDGAKRDRLNWLGDLALSELTDLYTFDAAPSIVHDSLYMFTCQQVEDGNLPPYSAINVVCPSGNPGPPLPGIAYVTSGTYVAWYVVAAYNYYLYTGDTVTLAGMMPVLRRALQYLDDNAPRSLYRTPPTEFDWHPFDITTGESANTNAVYYWALRAMATLEQQVAHNSAGAGAYPAADQQRAADLRQAMLNLLWDPVAGAFLVNTDDALPNHPQDANVMAVVSGLLTGPQATTALGYLHQHLSSPYGTLTSELTTDPYMSQYISPYIGSWELWARFMQHDSATALDVLRREFGHMANTDPNVTLWEQMSVSGDAGRYSSQYIQNPGAVSLAHAWSTGPTSALSAWVLGLRPLTPGFATWIIEPQLGDLRWAQGQVGTPHGSLVSRWERGAGDNSFRLTVRSPSITTGTVAVPLLGTSRTIAEDGVIVWQNGAPAAGVAAQQRGDYVDFTGISGLHTFAWSFTSPAASIAISPTSDVPFQTITITGANFGASEPLKIFWDSTSTPPLVTSTIQANGAFVTNVTVPRATAGAHTLIAVGQTSGKSANTALRVQPAIFLIPSAGKTGSVAYLIGVGFGAGETVAGLWYPGYTLLNAASSDSVGTIVLPFLVPPGAPGTRYVIGYGVSSKVYAASPFTITATAALPLSLPAVSNGMRQKLVRPPPSLLPHHLKIAQLCYGYEPRGSRVYRAPAPRVLIVPAAREAPITSFSAAGVTLRLHLL